MKTIALYQFFNNKNEEYHRKIYMDIKIKASLDQEISYISNTYFKDMYEKTKELTGEELYKYREIDLENDMQILDTMFEVFNVGPEMYMRGINYSMSTGDIVKIDDVFYVCKGCGWEQIQIH